MPKKDIGFQPLPARFKPIHLWGHRVHLQKSEIDVDLLPHHPTAFDSCKVYGGRYYHGRNGDPIYYRTMPYAPGSLPDGERDLRSRSESPRRARAARQKYYSFRDVHPDTQRTMLHLDMNPPTDLFGYKRAWAEMVPVLPAEAPVVMPSKRQLYEQAQGWPRPPRRHHAVPGRQRWHDTPRRKDELPLLGGTVDHTFGSHRVPRKATLAGSRMTDSRYMKLRRVCDSYGLINDPPLQLQFAPGMLDLDVEELKILGKWIEGDDGDIQTPDCSNQPELLYGQDGEVRPPFSHERDVDALFAVAEQKHALKMAAKRKRLQRQGWDVWDGDSILSPELEWEDVQEEAGEDFELL